MSRKSIILLVVLCAAVAALIVLSQKKPAQGTQASIGSQSAEAPSTQHVAPTDPPTATRPVNTSPTPPTIVTVPPENGGVGRTATAAPGTPLAHPLPRAGNPLANTTQVDTNDVPEVKPLPVLEKDYASATNRDTRLDIMMDIAEMPGAESIRALTRLFEIETDPDLKVDLIDSLLGVEGFKEEKLIMLTMGARQRFVFRP